jgi:hypothetical protein
MPVSDLDVHRAAHLLIAQFGDNALAKAREMVEAMRRRDDLEGADTWLRIIIIAIGALRASSTDARGENGGTSFGPILDCEGYPSAEASMRRVGSGPRGSQAGWPISR